VFGVRLGWTTSKSKGAAMFGLTQRAQRWKAEQKLAETLFGFLASTSKTQLAEARRTIQEVIACNDAQIAELQRKVATLESQLSTAQIQISSLIDEKRSTCSS
jgi:TolA-binding protein